MSNTLFRKSLLATTVFVGAAALATPAFGQDTNADAQSTDVQMQPAEAGPNNAEQNAGEEIVVTGTLIRNPNLEAAAPVTVVGEEEFELRQTNVAEELLRELPGFVPSIGSAVNNGNAGASFVNLRGLGSNRNLVLLDGTRLVPAGLGGVVNLNNIPVALVERVDVLTGGASTTYGADAVTGVVNFVTKDDFAGMELELGNEITERGDGHTFRADLSVGANFDDGRGNAVLSLGYQEADAVFQGARDISRFNIDSETGTAGGSPTAAPSVFRMSGFPTRQFNEAGALVPFFAPFNFNPFNIFQTPFERFNIFGRASYEVADGIQVYNQGLFSRSSVSTIIAPSGSFGFTGNFNLGNPFLPAAARDEICRRLGLTAAQCTAAAATTNPNDPNFRAFRAGVARRFVEFGPRTTEFTSTVFSYRAGIRGDITENLGFDVFGLYGESENISRSQGQGLRSRLVQAVDAVRDPATGQIVCRNSANGCVPINLFGPVGSIAPTAADFIDVGTSGSVNTSLSQVRGVVSGDFGFGSPLAEEAFGVAVGAEYRRYTAQTRSDVASQTPSEVLGSGGADPDVDGEYDVREAFAELILPLIERRPFFHSLSLDLGARYSDYSTSGGSTTYRVGARWEPVPSLTLRGNYNRAVRSPNIGELFFPVTTSLDNLAVDPCQGRTPVNNTNLRAVCLAQGAPAGSIGFIEAPAAGQVNITGGGNPDLDVETATTYTVGFVFQPDFIPGFALTVDYYDITVKDAITSPTISDALQACFGAPPFTSPAAGAATNPACTQIRRDPFTGALSGEAAVVGGIFLGLSNQGRLETNGIDVSATYRRDLGFGRLNLSFTGNWTDKLVFQAVPGGTRRDCVGQYSVNCGPPVGPGGGGSILPEFTFNQRTSFTVADTTLSLLWRYIHSVEVEESQRGTFLPEFERIDAKHYFDLSMRQEISDNFSFTFTVQNLFDKDPPAVGSTIGTTAFNSGNTFPSTYDALGRRYGVTGTIRF